MDKQEEVTLVGAWYSPYACRVQWALKLKGIPFQVIEEDVYNKSPLLHRLNPVCHKIPVLVHNGKVIIDSLCIVEYIDETWKHQPFIMPQDPCDKAMARFWGSFIEDKLHKAMRRAKVFVGKKEKQEKELTQAKEALQLLEQELKKKGKTFFGGDSIGYVDIALGWTILWLNVFEEVSDIKVLDCNYPILSGWIRNFASSKIVKGTLPPRDKLVQFLGCYGQYPRQSQYQ